MSVFRPNIKSTATPCQCDFTDEFCDKNCCCDQACTDTDRRTFSNCDDLFPQSEPQDCYITRVTPENGSREEKYVFRRGIFCILINNNKEVRQYSLPKVEVKLGNLVRDDKYSFEPDGRESVFKSSKFYKTGDPIFTLADDGRTVGFLQMPDSGMTTTCVDETHAVYMKNHETKCSRILKKFPADCSNTPMIRASSYYKGFSIIQSPEVLNNKYGDGFSMKSSKVTLPYSLPHQDSSVLVVKPVAVHECVDANGDSSDCAWSSGMDAPSVQTAVCNNVVVKVNYLLNFNGTDGLKKASVRFTFMNNMVASPTDAHVQQVFRTRFIKIGEPMIFEDEASPHQFSGQPGYIKGSYLRVGLLDKNHGVINMDNYRQGLTIMTTVHDDVGVCKVSKVRTPVEFGHYYMTACVVKIAIDDATKCQNMAQTVWTALVGSESPTHIATYGNSDTKNVEEWIKIEKLPKMPEMKHDKPVCSRIISKMHLQIQHIPTGDSENPQHRIVAAEYKTEFIEISQYKSQSINSSDRTVQFEITAMVTFVDLTNKRPV